MAGDWLKIERSLSDKPEVWAIAASLEIDPDAVVGKLIRVWGWFDEQTEEGNAPSVTKMLLDRRVGVTGFCDAMTKAGWMDDDGETLTLPNFDRHNGKTAKNRALTAKRVANHKKKSNAKGNAEGNDKVVSSPLPREEKRREEDKTPCGPPKKTDAKFTHPKFDEFKSKYPKRAGSQPWPRAWKAIRARLRQGHTWEEILAGVERYAAFCQATNKIGTETVMQAATFCGPDKRFLEPFDLPREQANGSSSGRRETHRETGADILWRKTARSL